MSGVRSLTEALIPMANGGTRKTPMGERCVSCSAAWQRASAWGWGHSEWGHSSTAGVVEEVMAGRRVTRAAGRCGDSVGVGWRWRRQWYLAVGRWYGKGNAPAGSRWRTRRVRRRVYRGAWDVRGRRCAPPALQGRAAGLWMLLHTVASVGCRAFALLQRASGRRRCATTPCHPACSPSQCAALATPSLLRPLLLPAPARRPHRPAAHCPPPN